MDTFTINELAKAAGVSMRAIRGMLNDAGATPRLDVFGTDSAKTVDRDTVADLVALRGGDHIGRALARLLREHVVA
jgi:hypothetical protein